MTTTVIRKKLQDYIRDADDKKVKAIYTILEKEITEEYNWWEDEEFVAELDNEFEKIVQGKAKTYTKKEIEEELKKMKKQRAYELQK